MLKRFLKCRNGPAPDGSGVPVLGVFREKVARLREYSNLRRSTGAMGAELIAKDSALRKTLTNKLGSVRARKILAETETFPEVLQRH